jgi:hypothetical protein
VNIELLQEKRTFYYQDYALLRHGGVKNASKALNGNYYNQAFDICAN